VVGLQDMIGDGIGRQKIEDALCRPSVAGCISRRWRQAEGEDKEAQGQNADEFHVAGLRFAETDGSLWPQSGERQSIHVERSLAVRERSGKRTLADAVIS
jgi:hypothetical protein